MEEQRMWMFIESKMLFVVLRERKSECFSWWMKLGLNDFVEIYFW